MLPESSTVNGPIISNCFSEYWFLWVTLSLSMLLVTVIDCVVVVYYIRKNAKPNLFKFKPLTKQKNSESKNPIVSDADDQYEYEYEDDYEYGQHDELPKVVLPKSTYEHFNNKNDHDNHNQVFDPHPAPDYHHHHHEEIELAPINQQPSYYPNYHQHSHGNHSHFHPQMNTHHHHSHQAYEIDHSHSGHHHSHNLRTRHHDHGQFLDSEIDI